MKPGSNYERILEVRELYDVDKVNQLLQQGNWKLLETPETQKVKRTTTKISRTTGPLEGLLYEKQEIVPIVNEILETKYVLGRYDPSKTTS